MYKTVLTIIVNALLFVNILSNPDSLYTSILKKYVINGLVNYSQLKVDGRLSKYLEYLNNSDPDKFKNENDKLAFWLNAYNAYTLKIILDNYPIESINELHSGGRILAHIFKTTIWDKDFVRINHKRITLNDIEHKIIRKKFKEPRIHFALVCAAVSCPPLRNEAYLGNKLDEQLTGQAKRFFNDSTKNYFDINNRKAKLSKIMDWYEDDFGENDEEVLLYISQFLPAGIAEDIKNNLSEWDIDYLSYNWDLNEYKTSD